MCKKFGCDKTSLEIRTGSCILPPSCARGVAYLPRGSNFKGRRHEKFDIIVRKSIAILKKRSVLLLFFECVVRARTYLGSFGLTEQIH